ncbi:glutamate racemase [Lentibacillus cibarius]|uniref:Glutamate racemase n=1 Tax=Lentibacillus cibarius TaxID=2583219 RepID=A0A5S3QGR7_9BACI|nr:glutamate racemase [Lentibacillus cibarius]TMN21104.1 glutamate racemase [Lentibacillus cibarius]
MDQAIGVIDSGVGGLTVAHELMRQLPKERLIYLGDTQRCPYGPRSNEEVKKFTWEMVKFLVRKNIKMLVVACNTATAFTLNELKDCLPIPVIGVIKPGARAAINETKNNHIGVIGTEGTISSNAYVTALKDINADLHVQSLACPLFVPMVEHGCLSGEYAESVVSNSLFPLKQQQDLDTLILGCTHYPLIKNTIQQTIGENVSIISSSKETAREASAILGFNDLLYKGDETPIHQFYSTGEMEVFAKITEGIFKEFIDHFDSVTIEKAVLR